MNSSTGSGLGPLREQKIFNEIRKAHSRANENTGVRPGPRTRSQKIRPYYTRELKRLMKFGRDAHKSGAMSPEIAKEFEALANLAADLLTDAERKSLWNASGMRYLCLRDAPKDYQRYQIT